MDSERLSVTISDGDLIAKLRDFEDAFVERKLKSDSSDWLKTAVGFANSCPIGFTGLMLVGVRDNGTPEPGIDCDALQKEISKKISRAYPAIYYFQKTLRTDDAQFVAVIVPGSPNRPHFAGPAFIRDGPETKAASEQQFQKLIASRTAKSYEIIKHIGETVSVEMRNTERIGVMGPTQGHWDGRILDCSQFVVVVQPQGMSEPTGIPLSRILLSRDEVKKRLRLEVYQIPVS